MTRILIADDEPDYVMFLRRKLENMGYEVEETYRGSEVVERLTNAKFDLLLLDYSMPDMPADEVCQRIKETGTLKQLPIVLFTAHSHVDQKDFLDLGVKTVLYKPLDDDELSQTIKKLAS